MKYIYTNNPDETCHEVSPGIFGRPAHNYEIPKLLKSGWTLQPEQNEEAALHDQAVAMYVERFGKQPRKNAKTESILKALEGSQNEEEDASETDSDSDGDQHEVVGS